MRRLATLAIGALALVAMLIAGCGSKSKATPTATSQAATSPTSAATSTEPIKLGMITSLTGNFSVLGQFDRNAVQLIVDQVNKAGGVNGRKVDVQILDDQSNPTQAAVVARQLISSGVSAIVGPVFSSNCLAVLDAVEAAKIPMITTCASDSQVNPVRPYIFMAPPTAGIVADKLMAYLQAKGLTKIAVIHDTTEFGKAGWDAIKRDAGKYGLTVVDEEPYDITATSFVPGLTHVKNSGAQALISWGAGPPAVTITKEFRQLGLTIPLLFSHAQASPLYIKPAGSAADGVIVGTSLGAMGQYLPDGNPSKSVILAFDKAYEAAYNGAPAEFAYDAYGAIHMILNAIAKVGTNPQAIQKQLEQTTFVSTDGTYHYSATNHAGLGPDAVWVARVQNGQMVPTNFSKNGK